MGEPVRLVGIFLIDPRGWVLLQERDEGAPTAPDHWGVVGGHVEPGEDWETARDRELLEETALVLPEGTLEFWYDGVVPADDRQLHWRIWVGRVDLTDADVTCGEGRQIVFVDPATFIDLRLSDTLEYFLPRLLRRSASPD